jgi:hypothetical protein
MKRIFRLDRLRLRGLTGARDEVLLTATAQNLRRLVKFLCRPPGGGLSSIAGASGVGTDGSMPQLPHRDSGTRHGKNTDDTRWQTHPSFATQSPRKRTLRNANTMSVKCQKQTHAVQQMASLFDQLVGASC